MSKSREAPDIEVALADFAGIKAAGWREGAERMLERCADVAADLAFKTDGFGIEAAIRALPLED